LWSSSNVWSYIRRFTSCIPLGKANKFGTFPNTLPTFKLYCTHSQLNASAPKKQFLPNPPLHPNPFHFATYEIPLYHGHSHKGINGVNSSSWWSPMWLASYIQNCKKNKNPVVNPTTLESWWIHIGEWIMVTQSLLFMAKRMMILIPYDDDDGLIPLWANTCSLTHKVLWLHHWCPCSFWFWLQLTQKWHWCCYCGVSLYTLIDFIYL
jgi:hypothetical protein